MIKFLLSFTLVLISFLVAQSQVSIINLATAYTQDFNTLDPAATAPSTSLPAGWSILEIGTSSLVDQGYKSNDGTLNSGDTYSYGTGAATERALGALQSGTLAPIFGVKFQNNSGSTITSLTVTYVGEQWRMGVTGGRKDTLEFQYAIGAANLSATGWITESGLNFATPNTTAAVGGVDGNVAANRTTLTLTISGISIPVGEVFMLRFLDKNISGADDGLGIDDMVINFNGAAATACVTPTAQPTAMINTPTTTSVAGSFTAASPAPTSYLVVYTTSATLTAQPVDGTTYTAGQALGGGTVVQYGSALTYNITGLIAGTTYNVFVYSANSAGCTGGPKYFLTTPLTGSTTTTNIPNCIAPTAAPTVLLLTPTATSVSGSFTASASANRYLVIRSSAASLSAAPVDGTAYTAGQALGGGIVVAYGSTTSFNATGLVTNTAYNFFVFAANGACVGEPKYFGTSLNGSVTTLNNSTTGYYNATAGLNCQALKTALYNITSTGTTVLSYTPGVWNAYASTDTVRNFENNATIVYDMYSNKGPGQNEPYEFTLVTNQCGNYSAEGQCYNREHTVPQSWFNQASPMVSDIHHVVPSDGWVNGQRGNLPFGTVGTATFTSLNGSKKGNCTYPGYTGQVFEPINEFKGDFARMIFYMAVRYENVIASWQNNSSANEALNGTSYQVFDDWQLKQLYDWHIQDPVSAKEIARNNAVFATQGNRNPFIDSAQFALRIWSCTGLIGAPTTVATPQILNVNNKCRTDASARGKVANPPVGATVAVTVDGAAVTYTTTDSTFQYFTQNVTTAGPHTVRVTFTSGAASAFKDSIFNVTAPIVPSVLLTGNTTTMTGSATGITATPTNGGTIPAYQWQDSTGTAGWTNIVNANSATLSYTPAATGHKLRVLMIGNATGCVNNAQVSSNVLVFTVNTPTAIVPVNASAFGVKIAPNPVGDALRLNGLQAADKWQSIEVMDYNGSIVYKANSFANANTLTIDVKGMAAGNYVVILKRTTGKWAYVKFLKN